MYNLQKDYVTRLLPAQERTEQFSKELDKMNEKRAQRKAAMADLIKFQKDVPDKNPDDFEQVRTYKPDKLSIINSASLVNKQRELRNAPRFQEKEGIQIDMTDEKSMRIDVNQFVKNYNIPGETIHYMGDSVGKAAKINKDADLFSKFNNFLKKNHYKLTKAEEPQAKPASIKPNLPKLSEPVISTKSPSISDPPSTFIALEDSSGLVNQETFNFFTQRKGRRASRFPDAQWDCASGQISRLLKFLCIEEVSLSYQPYCKPIFAQFDSFVESFLYNDNDLEICQNIHMCPIADS